MTVARSSAVRPFAAVCVAACLAGPAFAATSWSVPAGSSDTITYSNGQTQNGLFTATSPTVGNDTFVFTPQNFSASSDDDSSASDTASALVSAKSGRGLSRFTAHLGGDYSTLGGTSFLTKQAPQALILGGTFASATGLLTLTNPLTHAVLTQSFDFGGDFTAEDGTFADDVAITLPAGWKSANVALAAGVTASADPGSTAFVQLKTASFGVETTQVAAVPLPPAVLAAIPGIAAAYFARRRFCRA